MSGLVSMRRVFNGRTYKLYRTFGTLGEARSQARVLRGEGVARITKYKEPLGKYQRYAVWSSHRARR